MTRSGLHLSRSFQAAVYLSFSVLLLTGAAWLYAQGRLEDGPVWEKLPHQLLVVHGGAAMVALLVLGALSRHVAHGWKARKNRASGAMLVAVNAFLVLTGYGLYYASSETFRAWLSRWHAWVGLTLCLLLPTHVALGWLIRRARASRPGGE